MEETNESRQALLAAVGLQEIMIERNNLDPFDAALFHRYTPKDYNDSTRKDMDEVYRMREVVLLHKLTGLRVVYLTTESYYGDELRYRVWDIFIITKMGKRVGVTTIDFTKHVYETPEGLIPFQEVAKQREGI